MSYILNTAQCQSLANVLKRLEEAPGCSRDEQGEEIERHLVRMLSILDGVQIAIDNLDNALQESDADSFLFHVRNFANHASYSNTLVTQVTELVVLAGTVCGIIDGLQMADTPT